MSQTEHALSITVIGLGQMGGNMALTLQAAGFEVTASSAGAPVAAFECRDRRLAGVQYHPEVLHSQHGQRVLENFLYSIAGCAPTWTSRTRRSFTRASRPWPSSKATRSTPSR